MAPVIMHGSRILFMNGESIKDELMTRVNEGRGVARTLPSHKGSEIRSLHSGSELERCF